ncbi:hypothetical protein A2567_00835 [Candidatus Azambacteria bacterium RIFOXYD1_FULL_42_11]|uniref:Uncharacterized protein n=3 Tax=Candidatus Azamiibacteriota TaxID=1752741 RepID=A0A0G0ZD67_9BACT|nr:MAG: hypothetical protein UV10_C0001G0071 [Candidatus Azambacteria bacterium GW2011_GWA1_42_19]KKS75808.1 MAG: hypothetical protein UV48_C0006G0022 [Candidatus Azambacteria bacterium GW2011_GWA2_42_9]KKS88920.1 MAG: hypothetical protein UV62_C0001G0062 [Parcubacteria group bacterium GW2011_GWC1_43_11]OGD41769.1 MAG: hypothetical protein A2567_00835 [Candidatus Azambacteria bacterium RIFOXYD1_FULL_42_11]
MKNIIIKNALVNALLTALYIVIIASFMFYGQKFFGGPNQADIVLMPIIMLSLLVFSTAVVGSLIFGRPIMWYLDGQKKEAISLLVYTLGIFLIITILALVALFIYLRLAVIMGA